MANEVQDGEKKAKMKMPKKLRSAKSSRATSRRPSDPEAPTMGTLPSMKEEPVSAVDPKDPSNSPPTAASPLQQEEKERARLEKMQEKNIDPYAILLLNDALKRETAYYHKVVHKVLSPSATTARPVWDC